MCKLSDVYNSADCKRCKTEPTFENVKNIVNGSNMEATVTDEDKFIAVAPSPDTNILKLANILNNKIIGCNHMSLSSDKIKIFK